MQKRIEVEHRGRFSKEKHDSLMNFLVENATDLGQDDKNVFFFVLPDKLLKVTSNISKQTAKITGKLNKIGQGSGFEEIEFPIEPQDVDRAVALFKSLGFTNVHDSFQQRHNFLYEGVEIALKYSEMWGYHAELEIVVADTAEQSDADKTIMSVAQKLGVDLMTDVELQDFIAQKAKEHNLRL